MKILKFFILLLLCPFLTASYSSEQPVAGPNSYPELTGFWAVKPVLKVCKTASVPDSRVKRAVSYWDRLGYEFEEIIFNDESSSCHSRPLFGEIVITAPDQSFDFDKLAITKTTRSIDINFIMYSIIYFPSVNHTKERILEHEIGHALGWGHTFRTQHIMNENWIRGGHDSLGLRHSIYIELSNKIMDEDK